MGMIYLPHRRIHHPGGSLWADWDEASEDTLSVDQDGDGVEDTYLCFFENPVAGGDETGRGVVAGVDLVLTQAGNVAGATGSPPTRAVDGSDDFFTLTQTLADTLIANAAGEWTVFLKIENIDNLTDGNNKYVFAVSSGGNIELIQLLITGAGNLMIIIQEDGGGYENATTVDAMSHPTTYYLMIWADGVNKLRAGFATSKLTKWSDFGANNRVEVASYTGNFIGEAFSNVRRVFTSGTAAASHHVDCDAFYFGMSTVCLIDNTS